MALFPPMARTLPDSDRRLHLLGWPWVALGLFFVAFFSLVADAGSGDRQKTGLQSAESSSDTRFLVKRTPLRFVAENDRRDNDSTASRPEPVTGTVHRQTLISPECGIEDLRLVEPCLTRSVATIGFQSRAPPASS